RRATGHAVDKDHENEIIARERDDARALAGVLSTHVREYKQLIRSERRRSAILVLLGGMCVAAVLWFLANAITRGVTLTYGLNASAVHVAVNAVAALL